MRFFVGTSGFMYKEWKGSFYPKKFSDKKMLNYYAQHLLSVEMNSTFRHLPTAKAVEAWAKQVPKSFRFVLKAHQSITHFKRLNNVESETDDFLQIASLLGKQLGPILVQLPPNFRKEIPRLSAFLDHVDGRAKFAFEFRHPSWLDDEPVKCLRTYRAALCIADAKDLPKTGLIRTTNWGYLRLRREKYPKKDLLKWIQQVKSMRWKEAYVFFKHEDSGTGPKLAARFIELTEE